jgi:hypothetical protein
VANDGLELDGGAQVVLTTPVASPPTPLGGEQPIRARVIDTAPSGDVAAVARTADAAAGTYRVRIGARDVTYLNDAQVVVEEIRLIDPLKYGGARITLPGVNPQFVDYDLQDRYGLQRVVIEQVVDGEVVNADDPDYKGFVSRIDTSGTELSLTLGGEAAGRLSGLYVTPPVYRRKQDVEHILCDTLRDARVRAHQHDGSSGVGLVRRGGTDGLSIFQEYLDIWSGETGDPITFTPNDRGAYRKTVKDTETIHGTIYPDSSLASMDLSIDFMEAPMARRVYARGFNANKQLIANIKTPGLNEGQAPTFPYVGSLTVGDEDADTTTGAGVTSIQELLAITNFYDVEDGTPGVYDDDLASAVMTFQAVAGLTVTGDVDSATWDEMWNISEYDYSVDDAREYPTAQDARMKKWHRTANGIKIRANDLYDEHLPPNDIFIDVGGPFPKVKINRFAESKLAPDDGVWMGQITLWSGYVDGEHNPGDPFDSSMVRDRRNIRPNQNFWLPYFNGGMVVMVAGVHHTPTNTTLLVSNQPATTMEVWEAKQRRKETRSTLGRGWAGHVRASQVRNDTGPTWDTSSGLIADRVALVEGWNEVKIPAGQAGMLNRIEMQLEDAAEFAVIISKKRISVGGLNSRIPTPLTAPSGARPWYEREGIVRWLDRRGLLDAWGTPNQPCGYDPSRKTGDDGAATAEPTTGLFREWASATYETGVEPVLFTYTWVGSANVLMPGRVLRNQRTTDF